jgi:hypothetical protein
MLTTMLALSLCLAGFYANELRLIGLEVDQ